MVFSQSYKIIHLFILHINTNENKEKKFWKKKDGNFSRGIDSKLWPLAVMYFKNSVGIFFGGGVIWGAGLFGVFCFFFFCLGRGLFLLYFFVDVVVVVSVENTSWHKFSG